MCSLLATTPGPCGTIAAIIPITHNRNERLYGFDKPFVTVDERVLAEFMLTTMEGGVMRARSSCDVIYFHSSVAQLRSYFELL